MAEPMPADNPFLNFPYGPVQMECDAWDLVVEGEIPADLNGTLYRNGPNQRFKPRGDYHLFAGDGMVHAFHIGGGKVNYNNRWVRTAKWNIEDREGRAVINAMNPFDCDPAYSDFVLVDKEGLANTAIVWHGGRLLALEEGHQPYEIDPDTLDSIGPWTFRGKLHSAMTAHPKVDPHTGEMIFFAYMASGPFAADVMVHKVDADGLLTESIVIPTPYCAMVHDFVVTENYIIIPVMPITGSLERAMEGASPFAWEPERGSHIGVLPRTSSSAEDIRWIPMDSGFTFHFMNGFESGNQLILDCCQFEHPPLFAKADGTSTGQAQPWLSRWTIDLGQADAKVVSERIGEGWPEAEFPECDQRYRGREYRHGWHTAPDGALASTLDMNDSFYNCLVHVDHHAAELDRYSLGQAMVSEALFVPKSETAAEGDGYLLALGTDFKTRNSSLYIFDALKLSGGPLAIAHLSHRVPSGFHGFWRPGV